jgi:glycosyltransferase involved in cell wall biosynthesis
MKKVLWITSWFPPRVDVATIRNIKFLKYLPQFGWQALVICPREAIDQTQTSRNLLSQLDASITVSHGPRDLFYGLLDRQKVDRKARYLIALMNNIIPPDGHLLWSLAVLRHVGRQIRQYHPELLYTNCSPFSSNLIGAWAKYKYRVPWVTDFRDLWTLNPMFRKRFLRTYHKFVSGRLERFYLKRCDALIVNTQTSRTRMVEKYPSLNGKIWVIPNGYDQADIQRLPENDVIPRTFFYGGTINRQTNYTPLPLLELLARLPCDNHQSPNWVIHYGGKEGETFVDLAREAGIRFECQTHAYLDQSKYYDLIQRMEYVLLCMPAGVDSKSWVPARLYDYIGNRKRIICLAYRDSEVSRLLEQYGDSIVLLYEEPEVQRIERLREYLSDRGGNHKPIEEFVRRFSRREFTGKLAEVFEQVTGDDQQ